MLKINSLISFLILLLVAGMGEVRAQNGPTGGTSITNLASTTFKKLGETTPTEIISNEVSVVVDATINFSLELENSIKRFRGDKVEFDHFLINNGNVSSTFDIKIYNWDQGEYDLDDLEWLNGTKSKVQTTDTLFQTVTLNPGERFDFRYSGAINEAEDDSITSIVNVEAISREFDIRLLKRDSVYVLSGARIELNKSQSGSEEKLPNENFTYTISGINKGDVSALPRSGISIDGISSNKIILLDSIPSNVSFVQFTETTNGQELYGYEGNSKYEFSTSLPSDPSLVSFIGLAFDELGSGEEFSTTFEVQINPGASDTVQNRAEISYSDPEQNIVVDAASDNVIAFLPSNGATIDYYTDDTFGKKTGTSSIGRKLNLQATAAACNEFRSRIDTTEITLKSFETNDSEKFIGIETGINTSLFRIAGGVPTRNAADFDVIIGNNILETVEDDVIQARLNCDGINNTGGGGEGARIETTVIVDPYGIVFDSETNQPIRNAKVTVIDVTGANNGGDAGGRAKVFETDGTTPAPSEYITGPDGRFAFRYLETGTYKVEVETPEGYTFTSEVPLGLLPAGRKVDTLASYGKDWAFSNVPQGTNFDIPLDPQARGVLFTNKTVDRPTAEIGDYINYTITIKSEAINTVRNLFIDDLLPFGFEYQLGSTKLDGVKLQDPEGGKGPSLKFDVGDIESGTTKELTYRVFVGPGSEKGKGINVAVAKSDEVVVKSSNEAKVKVEVRGGLFNDNAYVIGKVFQDCNENDMQDAGEVGVPGVRLYMENGTYVVTDSEGKYTFYAVSPNKHVLKVDNYSLPEGSKLSVLDNRHANDPSSRFVDVKKGQLHRADFAICECTPGVNEEINSRRELLSQSNKNDLTNSVNRSFAVNENNAQSGKGRFDNASGTVGGSAVKSSKINLSPDGKPNASEISDIENEEEMNSIQKLEDALLNTQNGVGFLNLANYDTLTKNNYTIWVKGTAGTKLILSLNGEVIDNSKVGQSSVSPTNKLQGSEYVSIDFEVGENILTLEEIDPFGNVRGTEEISVFAPGKASVLKLTAPIRNVPADGVSTALIRVEILDENGILVGDRASVTLDTEFGRWKVEDLNKDEPGTQIFIEGGVSEFELISTNQPNTSLVRANLGVIKSEVKVEFLPDLRPLIAAGIIEGTLRFNQQVNISSEKEADGFERELKQLSYDFQNFTGDARLAFFIKGKISGRSLLTAGFDSEKSKEDRLFRDIRPDEFYPVYGESSIKGFDAQSSSRLYVRVDRGKTYALYGDFITQERDQNVQLGTYSRAQTGLKTSFEQGKIKAQAFGVNAFSSRKVREFQGQGISRYDLPDRDIVDNSEIIEIVTYDREQPEVVLSVEPLTRFRDYVIDPFSGVITFKNPVSSVDIDFNPVFIRATYEVTNNQDRYLIGGVKAETELREGIKIGANAVQDNNPENNFRLLSGNISAELGKGTKVVGEFANTNTDNNGSGSAARVQVNHKGSKLDVFAQLGKSNEDFSNEGSSLGQGRTEARARTRYKLNSSTSLKNELLFTRNDTTSDRTFGGLISAEKTFGNNINAEMGLRYSENYKSALDSTSYNTNIRGKVKADLPFLSGASAFGEVEQDLNEADKRLIAVGADYRLRKLAKLYARHEFISSAAGINTLSGSQQRNNTVFGIDANYMKNGKVYSEYRVNDSFDGRSGQAAIGLRNQFQLTQGLGLNFGFERVFTLEGQAVNDGTAITSAVDYTGSTNWKATARAEARFTSADNLYLNSLGYGLKLNTDWTLLTKNIISLNTRDGLSGLSKLQERLQVGAAYRSTSTNKFDALFRYEFKHEIDKNVDEDFFRTAHVLSSHGNYHPTTDLTLSGRVAAKYSLESDSQLRTSSFLELISGRAIYDIDEKWDAGINASLLANSDFTTKDYGLGVEAGFLVATNLRLAAGFNFFGYDDQDLVANNYTQKGAYLGFSYKFDERLFDNLIPDRAKKTPIIDPNNYLTCVEICEAPEVEILPFTAEVIPHELTVNPIAARSIAFGELETLTVLPKHIHFNNNSTYINQPAAQMLDKVAKFLIERDEDYFIRVTGHTDSKSSQSYNLALSERRAKAVRAYMVAAGVDADKLQFEGLSFSKNAAPEKDRVDMARNRRVELDLSVENRNIRFISQVEDLQVNPRIRGIRSWDYVFIAEHNAVPSGLNLGAGSSLNRVHEYLVQRVSLPMKEYQNLTVQVKAPSLEIGNRVKAILYGEGIAQDRIIVTQISGSEVEFDYSDDSFLRIYDQKDDINLINNSLALRMMDNLMNILRQREDLLLIRDFSQSYTVPNMVTFAGNSTQLSNEVQAILSRIGSYLKNSASVRIAITGDGSRASSSRLKAMKDYLIEWGIDANRIEISNESRASENQVNIDYLNADSINLLELDLINDGKGGGK